jgi:uncharacterized protein YvpB
MGPKAKKKRRIKMLQFTFEVKVKTPKERFAVHTVFATSYEKAKAILADRYLGQSPKITDWEGGKMYQDRVNK